MRFDPVSARYAEFGPFFTGLVLPAADACARVGLRGATAAACRVMTDTRTRFACSCRFPKKLVDRPMIYEIVKHFDVVPNIRRANVEDRTRAGSSSSSPARTTTCDAAIAYLEGLGCTVNRMEGDVVAG